MTTTPPSPNVVVIYADDLGWGDLGCFGADDFDTPALDALAANGVRLPDWYSNSPVCSPSRASLLTGRYPAHAGVEAILGGTRHTAGLPAQPTLATALRERGYATGIFGKWHLGADPAFGPLHYGFDTHFGFRAGCVDYYSHIYYWGAHNPIHDLWSDEDEVWLNGEYLTTVIAERASEYIEAHADQPFFCYIPFNAPHYPMHAPEQYVRQFDHLPEDRRIMAAMVKAMDDGVDLVMSTLERLGLRDDTLVFMSSDNGPSVEERNWLNGEEVSYTGGSAGGLRGHKGSLFEGGIRVPGIISWPAGLPAGVEFDRPGLMMDLLPTVLEAVDGRPVEDPTIDGRSLLGALQRAGSAVAANGSTVNGLKPSPGLEERTVCWEYEGQLAARSGRWKLVLGGREAMQAPVVVVQGLYDLVDGPAETVDLSSRHPDVVALLTSALRDWTSAAWRSEALDAVDHRH
jgi:arylsulfatase A-like enzyme